MQKVIIVSGPVIVEENKVLLDRQGDDRFWKFCGGKQKEGETLVETAIRRSKEELGIEIEILDENPLLFYTKKETPKGILDVILVHFLSKRIGEVVPGEEVREWDWISLEKLEKEGVAPNIAPVLKHFGFIEI
ncbi:NUDIX hydrolase [bacterium]|jgi:8-oxo-dGTP pyrophosphatase MutT (NUDIX family)|nr:NUDIX hydrolase [bacterium]MBT4251319.1 NUDIX hydrolase [bacterium]MBT4598300.1 NUDIX hydrolase [bacterium]MBT6754133.1 NUDIX hydrolase [bacterium]MBT7037953.1 NUDIX hydrolase [bacterium]